MSLSFKNNSFFLCILPFSSCPYARIFLDSCANSAHTALYSAFVLAIGDKISNQNRILLTITVTKNIIHKIT